MRELAAKGVAVLVGILIVALAALFAWRENTARAEGPPPMPASPPPYLEVPPDVMERGRAIYDEEGCSRCHSLGGSGNPRNPLDDVGDRLPLDRIRDHILAEPSARDGLSRSVIRAKEGYTGLPDADLHALAAWLTTLREP